MDFDLTEDQREIKNVAHEMLAARSPFAKVREAAEAGAYDPTLWAELVELGWPGIAVAEEYGGQGLGAVELAVLAEELGYACAATPFLSTATAAAVIQATGSERQRARWLPTDRRRSLRVPKCPAHATAVGMYSWWWHQSPVLRPRRRGSERCFQHGPSSRGRRRSRRDRRSSGCGGERCA